MQGHLAFRRESIADRALELGVQRQHGAEDFANRGEIVVGDPVAELQQLRVKHRSGIERGENVFRGDGRLAVVQFNDNARHALLAKRNQHAAADYGRGFRRDAVGEDHVQRDGHGNVAEFRH